MFSKANLMQAGLTIVILAVAMRVPAVRAQILGAA